MTDPIELGRGEPALGGLRLRRWRRSDPTVYPVEQFVAGRHAPRDYALRRFLLGADICALVAAFAIVLLLSSNGPEQFLWSLATLPLWVVLFKVYGLYDRDIQRISHSSVDDLPWLFHSVLLGSLLLLGVFRVAPVEMDISHVIAVALTAIVGVTSLRAVARHLSTSLLGPERVLLIGEGDTIATLARKMRGHPEYGVEPVGVLSATETDVTGADPAVLGHVGKADLAEIVAAEGVERVVVAHQQFGDDAAMLELVHRCRELRVKVSLLPQLFDALGSAVEIDDLEGITVLGVNPPVLTRSSRFLKRVMDLTIALPLALLALPVMAVIAVAIRLDSRGPVLFRQERIGRRGRPFTLIKFRTMSVDAEERRDSLLAQSRDPGWLLLDADPRVTRVGRFLRRSSLDELPQLWNVLRGQMSIVGPRPIIPSEDRQLAGWRRSRVDLTPGITGLWQVLGRTSIPFEEMVKLDYLYVTNWTLWTDVRLILRTLPAVLKRRGVN